MLVNDEFKELVLSDETLLNDIRVCLYMQFNKSEKQDDTTYTLNKNNYDFFNWYINENEENTQLKNDMTDIIKQILNDSVCNYIYECFRELNATSGKDIIYSLSRLLYAQDKFKNNVIGQEIDKTIKEYINLLQTTPSDYTDTINNTDLKTLSEEQFNEINKRLGINNLAHTIPSINYDIHRIKQDTKPFMSLWIKEIEKSDLKNFFSTFINNVKQDLEFRDRQHDKICNIVNGIIEQTQFNNFLEANKDAIKVIKDKTNNTDDTTRLKGLVSVKGKYIKRGVKDDDLEKLLNDDFLNEVYDLYIDYQNTDEYKALDLTNDDIKVWRDKADNFINYLETYKKDANFNTFSLDDMLKHLAYSDYQKKTYKTGFTTDLTTPKKAHKLSNKELKDKYDEQVLLNGEQLNDKKGWAIVDTNKVNNEIMNIRETIGKKVDSNEELTQRKINELQKKAKPTKKDLEKIAEYKELLKQQKENNKALLDEINELKDDIALINRNIGQEKDGNTIKRLTTERKKRERVLKQKQDILKDNGLVFQLNMEGKLTYEKTNKRKKENYKLIVNADYDIQNFNQEGRNFLQYIPNIPNVVDELNNDYITIDLDHYVDFNGISNPQRTRKKLQDTLIEMRKESYEYSYYDEKGQLNAGSLVLIGDVMSTEYKGKATIKVQLGGQFKRNIQQAIIKGQIAHVNKEVFKIGHGKNNKKEYMAKELYLYFVRLARTEAKKGLINGAYEKALKLDTIITYLAEINLINYNPFRYNETVKEPLQIALYTGQELGLYEIKTDAFKYYDDVISTLNNGSNVKDKVKNFENQLIKIRLFNDNTDLESNEKAHKTYLANQKKYNRKATKK